MDVDGTDTVEPQDMGDDMEMVEVDLAPPPEIEPPTMDAPEPEISAEAEAEVEVEIEAEINDEMEAAAPAEEVEVEVEVAETTEADTDTDEGEDESAEVKQKQKQKAANKIVKKMGDKGRYDGGNQLKTLVVMAVLGDSKRFFATTVVLKDAQARNLFTLARIPDAVISDNNYNQYFMFGGSSMTHDALVDSQYKG
jgi:archaellum component FlaD/FlaE